MISEIVDIIRFALGNTRSTFMENSTRGLVRRKFVPLAVIFILEMVKRNPDMPVLPAYLQQVRNCIAHNTELKTLDYHNESLWEFWQDCVEQLDALSTAQGIKHDKETKIWLRAKSEKNRITDFQQLLAEINLFERHSNTVDTTEKFYAKAAIIFNVAMLGQLQFAEYKDVDGKPYRTLALDSLNQFVTPECQTALYYIKLYRDVVFHAQDTFSNFIAQKTMQIQQFLPTETRRQLTQAVNDYYQLVYQKGKPELVTSLPAKTMTGTQSRSSATTGNLTTTTAVATETESHNLEDLKTDLQNRLSQVNTYIQMLEAQDGIATQARSVEQTSEQKRIFIKSIYQDNIQALRKLQLKITNFTLKYLSHATPASTISINKHVLKETLLPAKLLASTHFCFFVHTCIFFREETLEFVQMAGDTLEARQDEDPLYQPLIMAILNQVSLTTIRFLMAHGHTLDYEFSESIVKKYGCVSPYTFILHFTPEANKMLNMDQDSYLEVLMHELLKTPPASFSRHKTELLN